MQTQPNKADWVRHLSYFFLSIHLNMAPASGQQPPNTGSWPAAHNLL